LAKFHAKLPTGIAVALPSDSTYSLKLYYILSGELFDESGKFRAELAKQGEAEIARWKSPFLIKTFLMYRLVISEAGGLLLMGTRDYA